ncbi:MAG TPA: adenylate/guanylate cyclase domain-containing protein [Thermodesulfobacteriota bacterium]
MNSSGVRDFGGKGGFMLILIVIVVSAAVAIFCSFFYSSRIVEYKAREIEALFKEGNDFSRTAKNVLNARPDVAYIKLLYENGILKESFGGEGGEGIKEFELRTADNHTIMLGIREFTNKNLMFYSLLFSVLIGVVLGGICLFAFSFFSSDQGVYLERLISSMKRVSRGDFKAKLDIDESMYSDVTMIRVFESFNQMLDQLRRKDDSVKEAPSFQPTVVASDNKEVAKLRRVTVLVAKISDFQQLSIKLDSPDFTSFLTDYRKAASTIISDYGGVVDALLQDEIVALFNIPDEQDTPELRAICAAVEVLQVLATMNKERRSEGKNAISGKVGIDQKALPFYPESGSPQNVKEVITLARGLSENAPLWKVIVSAEVYRKVSKHVEVNELYLSHGKHFSIVGVEEGVIQL